MRMIGTYQLRPEWVATPRDCSLAVALPLSREQFFRDLQRTASYARMFRSSRQDVTPEVLWELFEPWAKGAESAISEAADAGVHVLRPAAFVGLLDLLPRFKATTLFAHWRSAKFEPEDIVDRTSVLAAVRADRSAFWQSVGQLQMPSFPTSIPTQDATSTEVAEFLNLLIAPESQDKSQEPGAATLEQERWHERRKLLERAIPGAFQGGAGIDFEDGWQSVDSIVEGIPEGYSGAMDLRFCESSWTAERIRLRCPQSVPIASEQEISTGLSFALYRQVIRKLEREPGPYEDAVFGVRRELFVREP